MGEASRHFSISAKKYVAIVLLTLLLACIAAVLQDYPAKLAAIELQLAKQRWERSSIRNYTVTVDGFDSNLGPCFIHATIHVEAGLLVDVVDHLEGQYDEYDDELRESYLSLPGCRFDRFLVPAMLSEAEELLESAIPGREIVRIDYDLKNGHLIYFSHLYTYGTCCGSVRFTDFIVHE